MKKENESRIIEKKILEEIKYNEFTKEESYLENNESKAKYMGEIAVIAVLEIIMLLFRLVQPIRWPSGVSISWQNFGNDFIFFGIELGLVIVIVAHFIFKYSFKEMGVTRFKENIVPLIINLCFVGGCVVAGYLGSQFSSNIEFDILNIILRIIANFIAISFLQELIFRGLLFNIILKITKGNGLITSVITAILFTLTYIPNVLLSLNEIQGATILAALVGPFIFGLYLSLLYSYGKNLWICTIIHGVCLSIASFEPDMFITILAGIYIVSLLIYLVYKIIACYKQNDEPEEIEESVVEHQEEIVDHLEEVIETPDVTNQQLTDVAVEVEETVQVKEESEVEDDLQKMPALSSNQEELGKVVNLQARKEQLARAGKLRTNLDDTIVMPSIADGFIEKETFCSSIKDMEDIIEREPNFIAHLEQYLGEFEGIYKQVTPTEPPIDIMYFSGENCNALVTNGMRGMPMVVPEELKEYKQVELMIFVDKSFDLSGEGLQKEKNAWLIKLLTDLATYPREMNSYLGLGHIVGNGTNIEPYDESVDYCGALIYQPMDQENVRFYHYIEKDKNIFIYNVMPLFADELRFIQEHSSERFINLMSELGVKQRVMPERINVVEEMNKH